MQFLNPLFLFGLLAISIPIIIHLFNFRRYKKLEFSSIKYLKQVLLETKKQKKVRNLLLLLSRILSILFLVLLFSYPYIQKQDSNLLSKAKNSVVVFIDNSFSMQNNSSQGSALDQAKQRAKEIIDAYGNEDSFMLLTTELLGKHQSFVDKKRFVELVNEVEISSVSSLNSSSLQKAFSLLNTKQTNRLLYFISDFQSPGFDVENFPMDTTVLTNFVPIEVNNLDNLYIDSISFASPIFSLSNNVTINIKVKNSSENDAEKVGLKLYLNDKQISIASVDIPSNQSEVIEMSFPLESRGIIHGRISILDNPISFDDDFFFTIHTKESINILSINSQSPNPFIQKLFSNTPELNLVNINDKSIDFSEFNKYSLIILNSLRTLPSGLVSELKNFRQNNGDMIIIPDNQLDLNSFSNAMREMSLPYYSKLNERENRVMIIDDNNSLFKDVFTSKEKDMEKPVSKRYFSLSQAKTLSNQVLFEFENKESFLSLSQDKDSKVYIFTSNLSSDNTNFVSQALFVPTLWNMALFSQKIPQTFYFLSGDNNIDITSSVNSTNLEVLHIKSLDNKFSVIPQITKANNRIMINPINTPLKSGNYNIYNKEELITGVSFNYDRRESEMRFLSN
ncbi:MAG: BatA domain-containing protein, partial [Bacteroidales bacterium]|nr:BatA domain-containing protein [Bacteroidales bacterium]